MAWMSPMNTTFVMKEVSVKIKFLKNCTAPQKFTTVRCECCGPMPQPAEPTFFYAGQEEDPEVFWHEIDLSGLTYKVDFEIIEYP